MAIDCPPDGLLSASKCLAGTGTGLFGLSNSVTSSKKSCRGFLLFPSGRRGHGRPSGGGGVVVVVAVVVVVVVVVAVVVVKSRDNRQDGTVRYFIKPLLTSAFRRCIVSVTFLKFISLSLGHRQLRWGPRRFHLPVTYCLM